MCGFLGEYVFEDALLSSASIFKELLVLSKHRGPDATVIVRDEISQLGFNRLAVLDLSAQGNQPKQSPSLRYNVVFNGEIYNYQNLKKTYELKDLNSSSDTEVIVHLLDNLGVEATLKLLNGMFSIAIVDTIDDCFYLARDFAGIKPLFYGISNNGIVAASQFDQIYKHPWFSDTITLRPQLVKEYFGFGYMQAPNTIYDFIFQVNPGQLLRINKQGVVTTKDLVCFTKAFEQQAPKANLSHTLQSVIAKQLASDVPIATFLSGGIDSPLISAYAKKQMPNIEAFTLKVVNSKLNESEIAKAYADHLNIKQHVITATESDLLSEIDSHFEAYSEPFGDYSSIPTFVISKEAKKQHTVMVSGDGGDELFFGYPRMLDVLQKRRWFKLPYIIRKPLAQISNKIGLTNSWAPYFKSFDAFIMNKHIKLPDEILSLAFSGVSFSKEMKALFQFKNSGLKALLHQLRWNEFYAHMQRILVKVDRASMAHSLEVRVPFLDKEIINLAWQQNDGLKSSSDLKKDLKILLRKEVPDSLINQRKMGFSVPLNDWLHHHLKEDVMHFVFEKPFYGRDVMNVSVLQAYVKDFFVNKHHNAWGVWHIYAWQKWAYMHVLN